MCLVFGNSIDRMPSIAFRGMSLVFKVRDLFISTEKLLSNFSIKPGNTVVDYGCGPGSYLVTAAKMVGETGQAIGADVHELAVQSVTKRANKENLKNMSAVLVENDKAEQLDDGIADVVYALDMFHMVSDPKSMLKEVHRICKPEGKLYIDDGHQPRETTKQKIEQSGFWQIAEETKRYLVCSPQVI